ncbi:DUF1796 family putative cysteine peptidase [Campylobacter coli]|uniref:DUF1796 family putative cysteine peptidase n=1 Tax=Campylobacter coli TaxID=195 RepID=UPI00092E54C1|nr:DUF1796 family putative cysteine peptidase [Campylobacter coli]HEB7545865.1 hypothetical protein [Campylobacter coli]HEB7552803.1 hypothetical protein [Campylobacter coli]
MELKEIFKDNKIINTIFIPIGSNCEVSWFLQKNGLRKQAFPFDWSVTPMESVMKILNYIVNLKNNFTYEHFFKDSKILDEIWEGVQMLKEDNLIFLPPTKRLLFANDTDSPKLIDEIITPVFCKKYNILYPHDFSYKGEGDLKMVQTKYKRRFERLVKSLIFQDYNIIFLYNTSPLNEWQRGQYEIAKRYIADNLEINFNLKFDDVSKLSSKYKISSLYSLSEFKHEYKNYLSKINENKK